LLILTLPMTLKNKQIKLKLTQKLNKTIKHFRQSRVKVQKAQMRLKMILHKSRVQQHLTKRKKAHQLIAVITQQLNRLTKLSLKIRPKLLK
jgi:Holliday junction resolvase-like predicted endonuclease